MAKVALTANFKVREGASQEIEAVFQELADGVKSEEGNLVYTVCRSQKNELEYTVFEVYESMEAAQTHRVANHTKAAFAKLTLLLAAPPAIDMLEILSEV
jgi:quinol monooxygenase YgiN